MPQPDARAWMLADALEALQSAERLQKSFFRLGGPSEMPSWAPPVDMYAHEGQLGLLIAMPGVPPEGFEVSLEPTAIVVRGERAIGAIGATGHGTILRMEIPYGRFERRIELPLGMYRIAGVQLEYGCLRVHLERLT